MSEEQRFKGVISGSNYDLAVKLSFPHIDRIEQTIGHRVQEGATYLGNGREIYVLEIGTGTGLTTERILDADPRIILTSVDNESKMVNRARKRFKAQLGQKLSIELFDAEEYLGRKTRTYDMIVSGCTLHNLDCDKRGRLYRQIYASLNSNGIFINGDKFAQDDLNEHRLAFDWQMSMLKETGKAGYPQIQAEWEKHYLEDELPWRIMKEGEYIAQLKDIGFSDVRTIYREQMEAIVEARK